MSQTSALGRKSRKYSVELARFEGPRPSRYVTFAASAIFNIDKRARSSLKRPLSCDLQGRGCRLPIDPLQTFFRIRALDRQIVISSCVKFALLILMVAMTACGPGGQRPLVIVQLCLEDQAGVSGFKAILKDIAATENLSYFDGSQRSMESLRSIGAPLDNLRDPADYISIHVHNENETVGFSAGNLGLSSYEVAVGFNGTSPDDVRRLAELVAHRLSNNWQVTTVTQGSGALPLANCRSY